MENITSVFYNFHEIYELLLGIVTEAVSLLFFTTHDAIVGRGTQICNYRFDNYSTSLL